MEGGGRKKVEKSADSTRKKKWGSPSVTRGLQNPTSRLDGAVRGTRKEKMDETLPRAPRRKKSPLVWFRERRSGKGHRDVKLVSGITTKKKMEKVLELAEEVVDILN